MKNIYEPQEDSNLLKKYVSRHAKGYVLDMGTGSGILAMEAAKCKNVNKVAAVDIQDEIIEHLKKTVKNRKIKFMQSDLFRAVKKSKFDTILFNPPYLPEDARLKDITLDGGKKGYEVLQKFFENAGIHLKKDGKILIVFSSLTKKKKVDEMIKSSGFSAKMLEKKHIFFEDLYVYLIDKA